MCVRERERERECESERLRVRFEIFETNDRPDTFVKLLKIFKWNLSRNFDQGGFSFVTVFSLHISMLLIPLKSFIFSLHSLKDQRQLERHNCFFVHWKSILNILISEQTESVAFETKGLKMCHCMSPGNDQCLEHFL